MSSPRRPLICGNWKMHKRIGEAVALVHAVADGLAKGGLAEAVDVSVAPPLTAAAAVGAAIAGTPLQLAGQNCHFENQGAFTGEVSAAMLRDLGCDQVIVGHSERRQLFGETDALVAKKVRAALAAGLAPIVCVGETLEERERNETNGRIEQQLAGALAGLSDTGPLVIAYEPVWAIGTGKTATPEQAEEVHRLIRGWLRAQLGGGVSERVRILYGGSVKPDGAKKLLSQPNIDGALVGGASLEAPSFVEIARSAS